MNKNQISRHVLHVKRVKRAKIYLWLYLNQESWQKGIGMMQDFTPRMFNFLEKSPKNVRSLSKQKRHLFIVSSNSRTQLLNRFLNNNFLGLRSFWIRVRRICIRPNPSSPGADKNWWIWQSWRPFLFFLSPSWFFLRSSQLFKINP